MRQPDSLLAEFQGCIGRLEAFFLIAARLEEVEARCAELTSPEARVEEVRGLLTFLTGKSIFRQENKVISERVRDIVARFELTLLFTGKGYKGENKNFRYRDEPVNVYCLNPKVRSFQVRTLDVQVICTDEYWPALGVRLLTAEEIPKRHCAWRKKRKETGVPQERDGNGALSSVFDSKAAGKAVRQVGEALDALAAIYQAANSSPALDSQAATNALAKAREALEALKTINALTAIS